MWTAEHRAAYMREYYRTHRAWIRVTYQLWYIKNRKGRNQRRRALYAAKRRRQTNDGA